MRYTFQWWRLIVLGLFLFSVWLLCSARQTAKRNLEFRKAFKRRCQEDENEHPIQR